MYYRHNYQGNQQNFQGNQIQQYPSGTAQSGNIYKSSHYSMWHRSKIKMALIFDTKMICRRKHGKIKIVCYHEITTAYHKKNERNPSVNSNTKGLR